MPPLSDTPAGAAPNGARDWRSTLFARPERLLLALFGWHLVLWVVVPAVVYTMLPLDTLELLGWGQQWQWGYYKHPPLGAWLGEAMLQLAGGRLDSLYLLAQLTVVVAFVYVWRIARLFLTPAAAVAATALLDGGYFYSVLIPDFNMNTLQLPVWAGFCFHFLRALSGRGGHWLGCGLFAALLVLSKYSGLLLIASAGIALLAVPDGRRALARPAPWLGLLLALGLLAPHIDWFVAHGALPIAYLRSIETSVALPGWRGHLLEPLRFAAGGLLGMLLSLLLFLPFVARDGERPRLTASQRVALLCLGLGPLLLTVLYGAVVGGRLKSTWAFPFFNLAGVLLFAFVPSRCDARRFGRFALALAAVALLTLAAHVGYKTLSERSKTAFDGAALTRALVAAWQQRFDVPLRTVVGDHILSAIVAGYAPSRPAMLIAGRFDWSPWLTPDDLARDGAIVVCPVGPPCFPALQPAGSAPDRLSIDGQAFEYFLLPPAATVRTAPASAR